MSDPKPTSKALALAGEHRVKLKEAVSNLELATSSPIAKVGWRDLVRGELYVLQRALDDHVKVVEAPDGLFVELTHLAPRLAHKIKQVRDEHPVLTHQVTETITLAEQSDDHGEVRDATLATLIAIVRHRQNGADLVFDGYNVDLGRGS